MTGPGPSGGLGDDRAAAEGTGPARRDRAAKAASRPARGGCTAATAPGPARKRCTGPARGRHGSCRRTRCGSRKGHGPHPREEDARPRRLRVPRKGGARLPLKEEMRLRRRGRGKRALRAKEARLPRERHDRTGAERGRDRTASCLRARKRKRYGCTGAEHGHDCAGSCTERRYDGTVDQSCGRKRDGRASIWTASTTTRRRRGKACNGPGSSASTSSMSASDSKLVDNFVSEAVSHLD